MGSQENSPQRRSSKESVVGILGGMGPEATTDFMQRIIRFTPARDDVDHVHCLVDNNPKIPSRIKALLEGSGYSPAPCMAEMARKLEEWGADFICIPCNTAHNYYQDVDRAVSIPVLNIVELTAEAMREFCPRAHKAGILASPAIRLTRLYDEPCKRQGFETVFPSPGMEEQLLRVIKLVKTGDTGPEVHALYQAVIEDVACLGAEVLAIACTELGLLARARYPVPFVDAADVLAKTAVDIAKGIIPMPQGKKPGQPA